MKRAVVVLTGGWLVALAALATAAEGPVRIGSKMFPESWVLGEALAQLARENGAEDVEHRSLRAQ